jgi:hypothetical protein
MITCMKRIQGLSIIHIYFDLVCDEYMGKQWSRQGNYYKINLAAQNARVTMLVTTTLKYYLT